MVTAVLFGLPSVIVTLLSNEIILIISLNSSLRSSMLSSFIITLNDTLVSPAGNVILYGPE